MSDKIEMPFGKYKGEYLGDIPADYLLWCFWEFEGIKKFPTVLNYIKDNFKKLELEAKNDKTY